MLRRLLYREGLHGSDSAIGPHPGPARHPNGRKFGGGVAGVPAISPPAYNFLHPVDIVPRQVSSAAADISSAQAPLAGVDILRFFRAFT